MNPRPKLILALLMATIIMLFSTGCGVSDRRMEEWAQTRQIANLQKVAVSSDQKTRLRAIDLLGQSAHPGAAGFLQQCLDDEDPEVRVHAAVAIGRLGSEVKLPDAHIHSLIAYLGSPAYTERSAIAEALGRIGDDAALRPLLQTAEKEEGTLQQCAIIALGEMLIRHKTLSLGEFDAEALTNVLNGVIGKATNKNVLREAQRVLQYTTPKLEVYRQIEN